MNNIKKPVFFKRNRYDSFEGFAMDNDTIISLKGIYSIRRDLGRKMCIIKLLRVVSYIISFILESTKKRISNP